MNNGRFIDESAPSAHPGVKGFIYDCWLFMKDTFLFSFRSWQGLVSNIALLIILVIPYETSFHMLIGLICWTIGLGTYTFMISGLRIKAKSERDAIFGGIL